VVARGGIELQFFVLKALDPATSYSSCYVLVDDVDGLYEAFTTGLREARGRVPSRGIPRIGPLRDMNYGVRQFVVVDPGGNYIRIGQPIAQRSGPRVEDAGRLDRSLEAAVTLADSKGDAEAAARVLDSAMAADPDAPAAIRARALILRGDLAFRTGNTEEARAFLDRAAAIDLHDADRAAVADELRRAGELEDALR